MAERLREEPVPQTVKNEEETKAMRPKDDDSFFVLSTLLVVTIR